MLITVDSVVRTYIHERGLVLHDYFRLLTIALSGLKDLAKDLDINQNVKAQEISVDETNSATLPTGLIDLIKVGVPNGDKILPLPQNDTINPIQLRDSQGNAIIRDIPVSAWQNTTFLDIGYLFTSRLNDKFEHVGRAFGDPPPQPFGYKRVGDRIQIDVRARPTCVIVIYSSSGVTSDINLIHPHAEETLKLWMDWKWKEARSQKGIWEKQNEKSAYYVSKRNLNSVINGFGYEDYIKTVRDHQVMTVKI